MVRPCMVFQAARPQASGARLVKNFPSGRLTLWASPSGSEYRPSWSSMRRRTCIVAMWLRDGCESNLGAWHGTVRHGMARSSKSSTSISLFERVRRVATQQSFMGWYLVRHVSGCYPPLLEKLLHFIWHPQTTRGFDLLKAFSEDARCRLKLDPDPPLVLSSSLHHSS